jgi:hypothetical protein
MSFETLSGTYDSDYYSPGLAADLYSAPAQVYVMAGSGLPADVAVGRWQSQDWTVSSFNAFLKNVRQTALIWDRLGWANGCWNKHPNKRREWVRLLTDLGKQPPVYVFLSNEDELAAIYILRQLLAWSDWLNVVCDPRLARLTPARKTAFSGLGVLPAIPLFYVVGAAAITGATTAWAWLSLYEWTTDQYNEQMRKMHETLLLWDTLGWRVPGTDKNACWAKNANKRVEWKSFLTRFSKFYGQHGKQSVYLPDGIELEARGYVRDLAAWGTWLENTCNIGLVVAPPVPTPDPDKEMDIGSILKWGAILVGGVIGLNLIQGIKSATR